VLLVVATVLVASYLPNAMTPFGHADAGAVEPGPPTPTEAADRAAAWLAGEVSNDTLTTGGVPDPGLAADAVLALAAAGRQPGATERLARRLLDNPAATTRPVGPGQVLAGATAKLILVATATGNDPRSVAGEDLVASLQGRTVDEPGAIDDGRLRDRPPTSTPALSDRSNAFTQAFGVLALARTGSAPADVVAYLRAQQCPGGGFRLFLTGGRNCSTAAAADVDTTALAVVALLENGRDGVGDPDPAVASALDWLESVQRVDGAWSSSGPGATANANSTGLAAAAARAGGRLPAADRGRSWIVDRQLTCAGGSTSVGAIAFSVAAQTSAADGIAAPARDQFRRSTAQALLALTPGPIGSTAPIAADSNPPCVPTSTVPTSTVPTSTVPTSTVPTSTVPTSTVPTSTVPTSTVPTAAVLGVTAGRSAPPARLALTGSTVGVRVGLSAVLVGLGAVLALGARRIRRRADRP
jgi:hypothetical protein